ncbi:MAG: hypothetical protein SPF59_02060 [Oscillospiraceae bacterium]|nr:hypothetical protein [Oscillospiraceae bacterium]
MRARLAKFMMGRNGTDALNRMLSIVVLVLLVVGLFVRGRGAAALSSIAIVLLIYIYFRMFSRNIYQRQKENGVYLRLRYRVTSGVRGMVDRWHQRKDFRFFKCPACRTRLRVPRGKGKINIVCRKCGTSFQRKT